MHSGHVISGAGHIVLIGWLFFGPGLSSDPLPFEVTPARIVTSAELAALQVAASTQAPATQSELAALAAPPQEADTPRPEARPDRAPEIAPAPEGADAPPADATPEVIPAPPTPPTDVTDEAPAPPEPAPEDQVSLAPPAPNAVPEPPARPAQRIAPTPAPPPPDDATIADSVQEAARPADAPDASPAPQTDAAAPEAAAPRIVTEAEEKPQSTAPTTSLRPKTRPVRTAAAPQPDAPKPDAAAEDTDAVAEALAEALAGGGSDTETRPSGPPLTGGERDALRVAVSGCWNVGSLSSEALDVTVVVAMEMTEDARPVSNSISLVSATGGSDAAARQAFEAARRAILRCGASGYDLPPEKYEHWRQIEMTFNPERMRRL